MEKNRWQKGLALKWLAQRRTGRKDRATGRPSGRPRQNFEHDALGSALGNLVRV